MEKRIGLFGGSFNPIHNGHLLCAERALEQLKLDKVVFLPNSCSPHKGIEEYAPAQMRVRMITAAIQGNKDFGYDMYEIVHETPQYTVDTLEDFYSKVLKTKPYWLCGEDSWNNFNSWKSPLRVRDLVEGFGVFTEDIRRAYTPSWSDGKVYQVSVPRINIRATDIRNRIRAGLGIRYMVPESVREIIERNKLYANRVPNKA